jgi:cytochrome c
MKKHFIIAASVLVLLQSCGSKPDKKSIERGRILVESSDCRTCHHNTTRLVGPSYADVAGKYEATEANINALADKIIAGGSGVWGDVPMTAHTDISKEDAKQMAQYVLSIKP